MKKKMVLKPRVKELVWYFRKESHGSAHGREELLSIWLSKS